MDNAFDLRLFKAKNQIDDALGVNKRGQQPVQQQPLRPMPQMQQPMQQPMQQGPFGVKPQGPMPAQPRAFAKGGLAVKPIWEKDRPDDIGKPKDLSAKKKKSAKARAKAAGRPFPNLIDNMAAARKKGK
jgi:hypothetical protein